MTNPDPRLVRAAICDNGVVEQWMGGEWESTPCIGCADCAPDRYRAPVAGFVSADRAWIAAQAARVRRQRAAAPMRFRAS